MREKRFQGFRFLGYSGFNIFVGPACKGFLKASGLRV